MANTSENAPSPKPGESQAESSASSRESVNDSTTAAVESEGGASRYFLVMFQSGTRHDPFGAMNRLTLELVQRNLDKVVRTPPQETEIDIWLESLGGDAGAAYKLFLELRSRCSRLRAVIPDRANSAATLLTIGTDRIYMAAAAELGPLDVQIEHPDRENVVISALEVAHALEFLGDYGIDCIVKGGRDVFTSTDLPRALVLKEVSRFASLFLKPIVAKLDPQLTRQAVSELNTAKRYARIMLADRNLFEEDRREIDTASLADHLVSHYPAHDFVISRREAFALGLPVWPIEKYDFRLQAQTLYLNYRAGTLTSSAGDTESLIDVFSEQGINEVLNELVHAPASEKEDEDDSEPERENENPEPRSSQSRV